MGLPEQDISIEVRVKDTEKGIGYWREEFKKVREQSRIDKDVCLIGSFRISPNDNFTILGILRYNTLTKYHMEFIPFDTSISPYHWAVPDNDPNSYNCRFQPVKSITINATF